MAASATPSAILATPTPAEGAPVTLYPRGTRTGVREVDAFIAAVESSSDAELLALMRYTPVPCSTAGYPHPVCPEGVAEGTPVDTLYNGRCDGGWYVEPAVVRRYLSGDFGTFAVARLPAPARPIVQGRYPAGEYLVVMADRRGPTGEPRAAIIARDGVVSFFTGCCCISPRQQLDDLLKVYATASAPAATFLLPPM